MLFNGEKNKNFCLEDESFLHENCYLHLNPNKKEGESRRFCIVSIQKVAFSGDIQVFEKKLKKIEKKY